MRATALVGVAAAVAMLAGCSSAASSGSASGAGATSAAATGTSSSAATSDAAASSSGSSAAVSSPGSAPSSSKSSGSAKPVAALLKDVKNHGGGNDYSVQSMPKARPEWIAAVTRTDSAGKSLTEEPTLSINLVALVDEAAKTEDLDSLVKLCYLGCDDLPKSLPAKDASGRTGYTRLSQLLEKTHPAPGNTASMSWDYPGFSAGDHGAATTIDHQDMKLLGVSAPPYKGLRTGFELTDDGMDPKVGWDAVLDPSR